MTLEDLTTIIMLRAPGSSVPATAEIAAELAGEAIAIDEDRAFLHRDSGWSEGPLTQADLRWMAYHRVRELAWTPEVLRRPERAPDLSERDWAILDSVTADQREHYAIAMCALADYAWTQLQAHRKRTLIVATPGGYRTWYAPLPWEEFLREA